MRYQFNTKIIVSDIKNTKKLLTLVIINPSRVVSPLKIYACLSAINNIIEQIDIHNRVFFLTLDVDSCMNEKKDSNPQQKVSASIMFN